MNKKFILAKVTTLGLLTTTLAFTNLEIATSKAGSTSLMTLQLDVGQSASALKCNSRCAKAIGRAGVSAVRSIWNRSRQQQQQQN